MHSIPLIGMVPVNLRTENDADGGNMVSAVLCNLGTHLDDPAERLGAVHTSMRASKDVLSQLPRAQAMALAAMLVKTGLMPRWLVLVSYLVALALLVASDVSMWLTLAFPIWVLVVSGAILARAGRIDELRAGNE